MGLSTREIVCECADAGFARESHMCAYVCVFLYAQMNSAPVERIRSKSPALSYSRR